MVRFHKRNFITVLLIACVAFSFVSPVFAAETTTAPVTVPAYTRGYLGETSFGDAVRSVMTEYSVAFGEVVDGMKSGFDEAYQNFIALFKSGGTDKNGVAQAAAATITDDKGYLWVPASLGDTQDIQYNETKKTGFCRISDNHFLYDFSEAYSGAHDLPMNINGSSMKFTAPSTGTYKWCVTGYFKGSHSLTFAGGQYSIKASGEDTTLFSNSFALSAGTEQEASRGIFVAMGLGDNTFKSILLNGRVFGVKVDSPSGSSFAGFGGGQTRGGGAGRKLDLIPAAKAGEVAAGGALTGSDVLQGYSLFDETSKIISIPQSDGTSTTYTANTWVYNYETRTYNITTTNDTVVNITYGNDKATVTDGSNPPADYYYASSDSSGGGGNDDSGGGFWDKILGGLADGILGFFKAVGVVLASIATGLVDLLTKAVESVGSLVALVGSLGAVVGGFFAFLPVEVQAAVSAGLIVVITFSVISVLRK